MNTNTTTLVKLPPFYILHDCIRITPAGIYCQETSIPLSISHKSIRDHMKKHHPQIKGRLENHLLIKLQAMVNIAKEDSDLQKYSLPDSETSLKWCCTKCNICFVSMRNAKRHLEGNQVNCTMNDLSKMRLYMAKLRFPFDFCKMRCF